ncbi:alpha/beta fold hydrolase [Rubritalea spongiae]|uniref:Alpha/beta fold hydrolase n=1 Tax=Rubritalea spongiae TaxID=430797 RepID=A0ABW5E0H8_9BACT
MKKVAKHTLTILYRCIGYGLLVTFVSIVSIVVYVLEQRADLDIWHEVDLDTEYRESMDLQDFSEYLALEDRLFEQLEKEVYEKTPAGDATSINRFHKGSMMDPTSMTTNWNRTFIMEQNEPSAGVLLLHGLSDSPYSLRHFADKFYQSGANVIGLRIPGHGTAPCGLVDVKWKDWAAAVRLAAKHLKQEIGDKPFYLVGYSNGGALSVIYSLESINEPALPIPDGIILLSPEIGVSKAASLAVWQGRMGHWLGLDKLAWNSIKLEYDPYKYSSFAVNAGDQAHRITHEIEKRISKMEGDRGLGAFPRVLAFQSAVDATVTAPTLVSRLFSRLPEKGHELVLFDINRRKGIEHLLTKDPAAEFTPLLKGSEHSFALSVVTNAREENAVSSEVLLKHRDAGQSEITSTPIGIDWPQDIFSLSHIALPFPESDPLYGSGGSKKAATLGNRALRGERGTLLISPGEMLRQKWNPFYPWMEKKTLEFMKL